MTIDLILKQRLKKHPNLKFSNNTKQNLISYRPYTTLSFYESDEIINMLDNPQFKMINMGNPKEYRRDKDIWIRLNRLESYPGIDGAYLPGLDFEPLNNGVTLGLYSQLRLNSAIIYHENELSFNKLKMLETYSKQQGVYILIHNRIDLDRGVERGIYTEERLHSAITTCLNNSRTNKLNNNKI